ITSQNHGFAVDDSKLNKEEWERYFTNLNDDTCEGIRHKSKPFYSVQFHPEASSGPVDTEFLFDKFIEDIERCKR
ncbi:MAG: carbamoyl-phosphate synthase (glutamine-hydrolyzing) small subunit, partial [Rikenellaceae bacterium]